MRSRMNGCRTMYTDCFPIPGEVGMTISDIMNLWAIRHGRCLERRFQGYTGQKGIYQRTKVQNEKDSKP
jgi:hypothetical protein